MTLTKMRIAVGLSQDDVAKALGVTQAAISIWERGSGSPRFSKIPILAKLYGTSEQAILAACMNKPEDMGYVIKRKRKSRKP